MGQHRDHVKRTHTTRAHQVRAARGAILSGSAGQTPGIEWSRFIRLEAARAPPPVPPPAGPRLPLHPPPVLTSILRPGPSLGSEDAAVSCSPLALDITTLVRVHGTDGISGTSY